MTTITFNVANGPINTETTPQVSLLFKALRAKYHDNEFTIKSIDEDIAPEIIGTKQATSRIFSYYQKAMIEDGLLIKNVTRSDTDKPISNRQANKNRLIQAIAALHPLDHQAKTVLIDMVNAL